MAGSAFQLVLPIGAAALAGWLDVRFDARRPRSPIRRGSRLYNIWDNRSEGMATAMEELILHAGYYDDNPRAREVVWIMLAQRCARGLASLYAHANQFDIKQAKAFQVEWTMRQDRGDSVNVAALTLSVHTGTHVDAGFHVLSDGKRAAELDLNRFAGPAVVVAVCVTGLPAGAT